MNKFSNVNWAAFLLGGFWGIFNGIFLWIMIVWGIAFALSFRSAEIIHSVGTHGDVILRAFSVEAHILTIVCCYVLMNACSIYLAAKGNHILSERIQKGNLGTLKEVEARAVVRVRQRWQILCGAPFRIMMYFFMAQPSTILFFLLLVIDVLSFAIVLYLAEKLHQKKEWII